MEKTSTVHKLEFLLPMRGDRTHRREASAKMASILDKENRRGFGTRYDEGVFTFSKEVITVDSKPRVCLKVTAIIPSLGVEDSRPSADTLAKKAKYSSLIEKLFKKMSYDSVGIYYSLLDGHLLSECQL